jgi:Ethanolamine utilization protein EutJ (predicted chaperonin)
MSISTTGLVWRRFYDDATAWPDGAYHEDVVVAVNGIVSSDDDLSAVSDEATLLVKLPDVEEC